MNVHENRLYLAEVVQKTLAIKLEVTIYILFKKFVYYRQISSYKKK